MKRNKLIGILNLISALCFYISSIIHFSTSGSLGALYLSLGSTFLCLGIVWLKRDKDSDDNK